MRGQGADGGVSIRGAPLAKTFVILQKARQQADYALDGQYSKLDVLAEIDRAEHAIVRFNQADVQHRRTFVPHALFKR